MLGLTDDPAIFTLTINIFSNHSVLLATQEDLLQECFQMVQFTSFMLHELKLKILVAIISTTTIFFRLKHNIPFSSRTSRYYQVTIITIYYYYCYYYITGYNITMTPQNLRDLDSVYRSIALKVLQRHALTSQVSRNL